MKKYIILATLIYISISNSFGQKDEIWMNTQIHCDTCTNKNCDTLIVKKSYIHESCSVTKDTIYSSIVKTKPLMAGIYDPIIYFVDFDYFVCSENLIDSNENYKEYKITQLFQHTYYRRIYQEKKVKLTKLFDKNHNISFTDSTLLGKKNRNKISYSKDKKNEVSRTKYWYHLNGKLKRTEKIAESNSFKIKYISVFNKKGDLILIQYFQFEPIYYESNEFEWILFEESTFNKINSELTIEKQKSYHRESESLIYLYKGENCYKTIEKTGCLVKVEINQKL